MRNKIKYLFIFAFAAVAASACVEVENKTTVNFEHDVYFDSVVDIQVSTDLNCTNYKTIVSNWYIESRYGNTKTVEGIEAEYLCIRVNVLHFGTVYSFTDKGSYAEERKIDELKFTFFFDSAYGEYALTWDAR